MLFYPGPQGPFSSVRFENIRDGIEDWESHMVLRDYAEALREKLKTQPGLKAKAEPLLAKADALLKVPDEVVRNMTEWTWEPQVLLKARSELGETIDAFARLVPEAEALAVQRARIERQVQRQREMLKARAEAARKSAATRPAAEE
jgi:hypothetical protein